MPHALSVGVGRGPWGYKEVQDSKEEKQLTFQNIAQAQ